MVELLGSLEKELKNCPMMAVPVHAFWHDGVLVVEKYAARTNPRYAYLFTPTVATEGGGIVVREKDYTVVVIYGDDRSVVIEEGERIYGLHGGKTYVLNGIEDIDDFLINGYDEGIFDTLS